MPTGRVALAAALLAGVLTADAGALSYPPQTGVPYPAPASRVVAQLDGDGRAVRYDGSPGADWVTVDVPDPGEPVPAGVSGVRDALTLVSLHPPASRAVEVRAGGGPDVVWARSTGIVVDAGDGGDAVTLLRAGTVDAGDGDDVVRTGEGAAHVACGPGTDTVLVPSGAPVPTMQGCEHVLGGGGDVQLTTAGLLDHVVGGPHGVQRLAGRAGFSYGLAPTSGVLGAQCTTDDAEWTTCSPSDRANTAPTLPQDGLHLLQVRPLLGGGAIGMPAVLRFFQDTTAPAPPRFSVEPPRSVTAGDGISWAAEAAPDVVPPALQHTAFPVGGTPAWAALAGGAPPTSFTTPGTFVLGLRSVDPAGNVSPEVLRDVVVAARPTAPPPPSRVAPTSKRKLPPLTLRLVGLPTSGRKMPTRGLVILRCPAAPCEARITRAGVLLAKQKGKATVVLRLGRKAQARLARGRMPVRLWVRDGRGRVLERQVVLLPPPRPR